MNRIDVDFLYGKLFYVVNGIIIIFIFVVIPPLSTGEEDNLYLALLNGTFRDSLLISLAVVIPCILDLFLDIIFLSHDKNTHLLVVPPGFFSRSISLAVTLSSTIILLYSISYRTLSNNLYWSILHFQYMGLTSAGLAYLRKFGGDFWTRWKIVLITILQGISHILRVQDGYILNLQSPAGILSIIFLLITMIYYSYEIYRWYNLRLQFVTNKIITPSIFCCILYMIVLWLGFLLTIIILFIHYNTPVADCNIYFITITSYFFSLFILINASIHARGFRLAVSSAQDLLQLRRLIVRYLSHEMRNPVNVINLGLKILSRETKANMEQEFFVEMQHASDTIAHILDDLLIYEKIEGAELDIKFEDVHAQTYVRKCALDVFHKHRSLGVRLRVVEGSYDDNTPGHTPASPRLNISTRRTISHAESGISISWLNVDKSSLRRAVIQADTTKLSHVIEKVLTTAIKVSPPGSVVKVTCRLLAAVQQMEGQELFGTVTTGDVTGRGRRADGITSAQAKGRIFRIEVEDTGTEIFQDFVKLAEFDMGILQGGQGAGLGLWVAKRIIDMHQGNIGVELNKERTGSIFYIEIPVKHIDLMMSHDSLDPVGIDQNDYRPHSQTNSRSPIPSTVAFLQRNSRAQQVLSDVNSYDVSFKRVQDILDNSYDDLRVPSPSRRFAFESDSPRSLTYSRQSSLPSMNSLNSRRMNFYVRQFTNLTNRSLESTRSLHTSVLPNSAAHSPSGSDPLSTGENAPNHPFVRAFTSFVKTIRSEHQMSQTNLHSTRSPQQQRHRNQLQQQQQHRSLSYDLEKEFSSDSSSEEEDNYNLNCLIVDDVTSNRKMLSRLLKDEFKMFSFAEDGLQAIEKVKTAMQNKEKIDVILMDYIMPNVDGPTATCEIRALGFKGQIFGVTGNAQENDIEHFIECGADKVFTKPLNVSLFTAAISRKKK